MKIEITQELKSKLKESGALQKTGCCGSFFGLLLRRFCHLTTSPIWQRRRIKKNIRNHTNRIKFL